MEAQEPVCPRVHETLLDRDAFDTRCFFSLRHLSQRGRPECFVLLVGTNSWLERPVRTSGFAPFDRLRAFYRPELCPQAWVGTSGHPMVGVTFVVTPASDSGEGIRV